MDIYYHSATDQHITDTGFTLDGKQYLPGALRLLTAEEKSALGLVEVVTVGEPKDPAYYWNKEEYVGAERRITSNPKDLAACKQTKLAELAAHRYSIETAGVTADGAIIKTDRESQSQAASAWITVQMNPTTLIDWKGADGWIKITKAQVEAIAAVVSNHVQTCFSNERVHAEAIAALTTVDELIKYDFKTGWPCTEVPQA